MQTVERSLASTDGIDRMLRRKRMLWLRVEQVLAKRVPNIAKRFDAAGSDFRCNEQGDVSEQ